jgi:hypothetical protein
MPHLDGVKAGDKVNMQIKMYFGLTEIRIECIIRDKSFVFASSFDAADAGALNDQQQQYADFQTPLIAENTLGHPSPQQVYGMNNLTNSMSQVSIQQQQGYPPTMDPYGAAYQPSPYQSSGYPPQQQPGYPPAMDQYGAGYPPQQPPGGYRQQQGGPNEEGYIPHSGYPPQPGYPPSNNSFYSNTNASYPATSQPGYPPQQGYNSYR